MDDALELKEREEIWLDTPLFLERDVVEAYSEKRYIEESPTKVQNALRAATTVLL